ncbi:MAG: monovalent cation/H+ antiporter complex subunit F [Bacteroidales bacterium]
MIILGAKIAIYLMILSIILVLIRLWKGPDLPDRVVAFELLAFIALGIILLIMVITGRREYLDIVIIISLVVFIATIAVSKFITKRD